MTTNTNTSTLRFFYNGIKIGKGKLNKGWFSHTPRWENSFFNGATQKQETKVTAEHIVFYADTYGNLPKEITDTFECKNDSDSMTDYFEKTSIRITRENPYWDTFAAMVIKKSERWINRLNKAKYYDADRVAKAVKSLEEMRATIFNTI